MDTTPALDSIARMLPTLPDEAVESLLVSFDALVGVSDASFRPAAAQLLRDNAALCAVPARQARLLQAAEDVAAGRPCAFTPDGLSAQQAAAAQSVSAEEWERRLAATPLPPLPGEHDHGSDRDDEEEEEEDAEDDEDSYMDEEPPPLPHLPVRHFFPGLVVRVAHDFSDAYGRAVCASSLLKVFGCHPRDDGFAVSFLDRNVVLNPGVTGHDSIVENAGNAWFQPVPVSPSLEDLVEQIEIRLRVAAAEAGEDEDAEGNSDDFDIIAEDLQNCKDWLEQDWLAQTGDRGPAPKSHSQRRAAKRFGRDHEVTAWIRYLFAAIAVCSG